MSRFVIIQTMLLSLAMTSCRRKGTRADAADAQTMRDRDDLACAIEPPEGVPQGENTCGAGASGDVEVLFRSEGYSGPAPACPTIYSEDLREWSIRLTSADVRPSTRPGYVDSFFHGIRLAVTQSDSPPAEVPVDCGFVMVVTLRARQVRLPLDRVLRFSSRRTVRHFEDDVSASLTVRDGLDGKLLFGWMQAHRPETWEGDLLPEFALQTSPFCQARAQQEALRVQLTTDGRCVGYHQTATCCEASGGRRFVLWTLGAVRVGGPKPQELVDLIVAFDGVIVRP